MNTFGYTGCCEVVSVQWRRLQPVWFGRSAAIIAATKAHRLKPALLGSGYFFDQAIQKE
jgi:hypothetical protein